MARDVDERRAAGFAAACAGCEGPVRRAAGKQGSRLWLEVELLWGRGGVHALLVGHVVICLSAAAGRAGCLKSVTCAGISLVSSSVQTRPMALARGWPCPCVHILQNNDGAQPNPSSASALRLLTGWLAVWRSMYMYVAATTAAALAASNGNSIGYGHHLRIKCMPGPTRAKRSRLAPRKTVSSSQEAAALSCMPPLCTCEPFKLVWGQFVTNTIRGWRVIPSFSPVLRQRPVSPKHCLINLLYCILAAQFAVRSRHTDLNPVYPRRLRVPTLIP